MNVSKYQLVTNREEIEAMSDELKKYIAGMENPFVFLQNGEVIAKGELAYYEDDSVEIKMVKTINKRTGKGRVFVEYLKNLPNVKEIWGEAVPDAVAFWSKLGAKFDPEAFEQYLEAEEHEEGFLVPFKIAC
jgi:hypothetical protein